MNQVSDRLHPGILFLYYLGSIGISAFLVNPILLLISFAGAISMNVCAKNRFHARDVLFYAGLFLVLGCLNPLFYHNGRTVLFFLNGNAVTLEACLYGAAMALMMVCILLWCRSLTKLMTSDKIVSLFGSVSQKMALLVSMILRFIPMYIRQSRKISETQRALGLYGENTLTERVRAQLHVFSAMTTWGLEHSMETADSMRARGYGTGKRTRYRRYGIRKSDVIFLLLMMVCLAGMLAGSLGGGLQMQYYPQVVLPESGLRNLSCYVLFAVFCLSLPVYEAADRIVRKKWTYLR